MATLLVDAPGSDPARVEIGSIIAGRYEVEQIIGRGGFGAVFGARHTGTGQGVALKILASGDEDSDVALRRFFQEARVTSGLRHPNTIRVFDFGQDDTGLVYIAMELLTGRTLKQELRRRRKTEDGRAFSEKEAVEICIAITRSLGEAHAAGLVHRDLKPDNVFLHHVEGDDPVVKVLDFGIVKLLNREVTQVNVGGGPGTPAYMSPEQALNKDIDGRSDLYSLGVMLYQLVCGKVPFRGQSDVQTLYLHAHEPIPNLRERAKTEVSAAYVEIVGKLLAKNPNERFATAQAVRAALHGCLAAGGSGGIRIPTMPSLPAIQLPAGSISQPEPAGPEQETLHSTPAIPPGLRDARAGLETTSDLPVLRAVEAAPFDMPLVTDSHSGERRTTSGPDESAIHRPPASRKVVAISTMALLAAAVTAVAIAMGSASDPSMDDPVRLEAAASTAANPIPPMADAPAAAPEGVPPPAPLESERPVAAPAPPEAPPPAVLQAPAEPPPPPKAAPPPPRPPAPKKKKAPADTEDILDLKI